MPGSEPGDLGSNPSLGAVLVRHTTTQLSWYTWPMAISIWQRGIAMCGDAAALEAKYDWWIPLAVANGITAVCFKVTHGLELANVSFMEQPARRKRLLDAGIKVGTWSFPTADDPVAEAALDVKMARRYIPQQFRWHVTNAEYKYKLAPAKCEAYAAEFRRLAPDMRAALCPEANMFMHPTLGPMTGDFNYRAFSSRAFRDFPQTYDGAMRAYEAADVWYAHARQDGNGSTFGPNRVKVCIGTAGDLRPSPIQLRDQMVRLKNKGFTSSGIIFFLAETMLEEDFTVLAKYCLDNRLILK